ncbi:MAG TPA: ATP-binding cassette domain-containing protein, partial [Thermomicrobiales bacterium]|nr:ATP-binding cassette domain-containing protein [Thermomicrobiales bacterium]
MATARPDSSTPPLLDSSTRPPAIEMRSVSKRFGPTVANNAVDFGAAWGEVHALIGENGAGKSTLMSILAGLYRPDAGSVAIDGRPVRFRSPRDAIAHGIGMVYQHFMLVEPFTVAENVLLGARDRGIVLDTRALEAELSRLGQRYGLAVDPKAPIWHLGVGEQQRVEILRLLLLGARILVFDEPTSSLSQHDVEQL